MTPEGFRSLAQDPAKMKYFSPSEQAAIRRAGGDDLVERSTRRLEGKWPPPLPAPDEIKELIKNVGAGSVVGGKIGDSARVLLGDPSQPAAWGTLIGAGVGALPTVLRASGPAAGSVARAISNRNLRNAEREIRNGTKPGANLAEARRALVHTLMQNEAIKVGQ